MPFQKFFTVPDLTSLEVPRFTGARYFQCSPEKACLWSDHWTERVRDTSSAVVTSPATSGSSVCGFVRVTVGSPRVPWWQGPASIRTTTARANGTALSARRLESTTPLCPRNWDWYQDPPRDFRLAERAAGSRVMRNFKPMQSQELHAWLRPPDAFFVLELNRRLVVASGGGESIGGCLETGRKMAPPFPQPLRDTLRPISSVEALEFDPSWVRCNGQAKYISVSHVVVYCLGIVVPPVVRSFFYPFFQTKGFRI